MKPSDRAWRPGLWIVLALSLLTPASHAQRGPGAPPEPGQGPHVRTVAAVTLDGVAHVYLDSLARVLGARVRCDPDRTRLELLLPGRRIGFTLLSPFFVVDGLTFQLPLPVRIHDDRTVAVAEPLLLLLEPFVPSAGGLALSEESSPTPETGKAAPAFRRAEANPEAWAIDVVVIDPGHGGKDPGALGKAGTREKDIVLKVARRLQKLLVSKLKVRTVLTRTDDTFVPLRKRARIAIRSGGKVFVSLHCNASRRRAASGIEVFFLSEAKTAEAAEVARMENAALQFEDEATQQEAYAELEEIARSLLSTQFLKESQDLAADVRTQIDSRVSATVDRGVKQANFYVMRGTMGAMPSVLVEMGFISNRAEERRLKGAPFQKQMAEAIYRGIETFKRRYEGTLADGR